MPQLEKGGKWVFGWVQVTPDRRVRIPADAWREYCFEEGAEAILLRGSATSGGFSVGIAHRVPEMLLSRAMLRTRFEHERTVRIPDEAGVQPGDRLLVVRGSGHALGFSARGPIFDLALTHPAMSQCHERAE